MRNCAVVLGFVLDRCRKIHAQTLYEPVKTLSAKRDYPNGGVAKTSLVQASKCKEPYWQIRRLPSNWQRITAAGIMDTGLFGYPPTVAKLTKRLS